MGRLPFQPGPELIFVSAISSSLIHSLYPYCLLRYASVAHIHIHTQTRALTLVGAMSMSSSLVDSLCRYCFSRYHRVTQTHTHTHTHTHAHSCRCNVKRCIGYFKLQVNFQNRAIHYGALLRKMTYTDKTCYISSSTCIKT